MDVRSEAEFARGAFELVSNIPILSNLHRHQVGLTYKMKGADAAVALGYQLVGPHKESLQRRWANLARDGELILYCWRGGMRSQIATDWVRELGVSARQVQGGFKSMRNRLIQEFGRPRPIIIIGGMAGVGKTQLLSHWKDQAIDLESLANHRGSAFGAMAAGQPSQLSFENSLGLKLYGEQGRILVEDESASIGSCGIPRPFYVQMQSAPVVLVKADINERVQNIYNEYIEPGLKSDPDRLAAHFDRCLARISKKLGGLRYQTLKRKMECAFREKEAALHHEWIERLLSEYYDPRYAHYQAQHSRPVWFEGKTEECLEWLKRAI